MSPYGKVLSADDLGRAIRAQRKARRITQEELAALVGVGTRFISELERGKVTAEIGKALEVAYRLDLELFVSPRGGVTRLASSAA